MAVTVNGQTVEHVRRRGTELDELDYSGTKIWPDVPSGPFLVFSSLAAFTLKLAPYSGSSGWDGTIEVSTDALVWTTWNGATVSAAQTGASFYVFVRGYGNTAIKSAFTYIGTEVYYCDGNIMTLLEYSDPESAVMGNECFRALFTGEQKLVRAPELPAMVLSKQCYQNTFYRTGITSAPVLPALEMAENCYTGMFASCHNLIAPPKLPSVVLANSCYLSMFEGCTSLISVPELPATTLAIRCYWNMFYGCTSLAEIPKLPALTLTQECYRQMFYGCTSIKLSATRTGEYQTAYRVPTTGTGTTAFWAVYDMFTNTGGTFTGTPSVNTTYYTSNTVV